MKTLKKIVPILLVLSLCLGLGLCPAAFAAQAAQPVTPTPPDWFPAEHYITFPGDEVYLPENWAKVLEMRENPASAMPEGAVDKRPEGPSGKASSGLCYEIALIRLRYADSVEGDEARRAFIAASYALNYAGSDQPLGSDLKYQMSLWWERIYLLYSNNPQSYLEKASRLYYLLDHLEMTLDDFFDAPYVDRLDQTVRDGMAAALVEYPKKLAEEAAKEAARIKIRVDGHELIMDVDPEIRNGRTMIPVRVVSEALGADVDWNNATKTVTLTRAGTVITMTLGSTTATVNGKPVEIDAPPYISGTRTLVPIRFVSEFFGQIVSWDNATHTARITEDKSVAGDSNLELWARPMGAIQAAMNEGSDRSFSYPRGYWVTAYTPGIVSTGTQVLPSVRCRDMLSYGWGIESREDLILTVCTMTYNGHNADFLEDVAYIKTLTPAQYNQYLNSSGMDSYMFPYTKRLGEKWGDRGIMCWDLFRMSNLVQWGYTAGYVTYAEALALLEPAATLLCENFSSWDEAYENYLEGYNWWARNDVLNRDIWKTGRGITYRSMVEHNQYNTFDDTLFQTGVISVPGVTAEQLLAEVLDS